MIDLMRSFGFNLNETQILQFQKYFAMLITENEKYNLTAITEERDVYVKHFLDSLLLLSTVTDLEDKSMIDIGTGAGFPSLPLKILVPSLKVTGLDSLNKRIGFLEMLSQNLGFTQTKFVHGRAEDFGQNKLYRESYDYAVSRAVAELRLLLELVMPFVKVGGTFYAYKSLKTKTELDDAKNAMTLMKSSLVEIRSYDLPFDMGTRDILIIEKMGKIDKKYPRKPGVPKKSPL